LPSSVPRAPPKKNSVARVADIYSALPSITGKLELEYEGELKGADTIARETDPHGDRSSIFAAVRRRQFPSSGAVVRNWAVN